MQFGKLALLAVACAAGPVTAAEPVAASPPTETGTIGQAPFRIDVPDHWNGELVVLEHGFEPVGVPRSTPMDPNEATPVFLGAGYAVAQSAYSSQGWAVRDAIADTEALRQRFVEEHGAAKHTYLVGFSMGGAVAVEGLERHPESYDGALSLCGANVPGPRLAAELYATLVAFDHFFPDTPGIPGGLAGIGASAPDQGEVMGAIAGALGGKPDAAAKMAAYLEVPVEAVPGVVSLHYLVFQDIAHRAGGVPVDNRDTVYAGFGDDVALNAGVHRGPGDAAALQYVATAPALTGHPAKPLVLEYNVGDPTILPRFQAIYAGLAASGTGGVAPVTLPPVGEGHCGFSPEQIGQAFQVLTRWVESGERPAAP